MYFNVTAKSLLLSGIMLQMFKDVMRIMPQNDSWQGCSNGSMVAILLI